MLYLLCYYLIYLLPNNSTSSNASIADYAGDKLFISICKDPNAAFFHLLSCINDMQNRFNIWCVKLNANKPSRIIITLRRNVSPQVLSIVFLFRFPKNVNNCRFNRSRTTDGGLLTFTPKK